MASNLENDRLAELKELESAGINPYPDSAPRDFEISEARKQFGKFSKIKKKINLVGRIMSFRDQGNLIFADIKDESGKIQLVLKNS
ncbi:MAG: OB-fold nucleic acid binding domain-containing protein, partial [Patescibacteria group bacterium]|nr:OB-fold nucleic acid binding domain-containing protein [Patescibacteria group bacterium]